MVARSTELDNTIRDTLLLLTKTRTELIATPATTLPDSTNTLSYSDLLGYARRISKYTLPPSYREPTQETNTAGEASSSTPKEALSQVNGHGTTLILASTNGADASIAMDIDGTPAAPGVTEGVDAGGLKENMALWTGYLNPETDMRWAPWPSPDAIRSGALASIQILVDQGVDPATFDPEKSAELEAERKRLMEEEDAKREEERARMEEERRREHERRMSASGPRPERKQEQPKVFQLETFDDDDDDD